MRLPYLQVDGDFMNQRAKTAAGLMGCSKAAAIGHITCLWAWALTQGPEDVAPTGLVTGRWWARVLSSAAEWEKEPMDLVEVLSDPSVALLEVLPDGSGARIRGLARYEAAWERQRKERSRKSEWARSRRATDALLTGGGQGSDAERVGQTQIKTQTHIETTASQEPAVTVPMADDIPQAAEEDVHEADERPALVLVEQKAEKPARKPSAAEALFERLERRRRILCEDEKLAFVPARWPAARINRDLGPVARAEKAGGEDWERFRGAWGEFIEDPEAAHLDVPYSLDWFWKCRSRYEGKALKAGGAT